MDIAGTLEGRRAAVLFTTSSEPLLACSWPAQAGPRKNTQGPGRQAKKQVRLMRDSDSHPTAARRVVGASPSVRDRR